MKLELGKANTLSVAIESAMANRHGAVFGATGTGKTITLQILAEHFSDIGVPVFLADGKGDLSGMCKPGSNGTKIKQRYDLLGTQPREPKGYPVEFWDIFGTDGLPVQTAIDSLGSVLLSRLLGLNDTQQGILTLALRVAKDKGKRIITLTDLRSLLAAVMQDKKQYQSLYGNISGASVGAIQRALLSLEEQGGDKLFGQPEIDLSAFMRTVNGQGVVNILSADKLINTPALYGSFLIWLMSELFERLPEVGDNEKPKLVLIFDESHLIFQNATKVLLDRINKVIRLIRSKGVGIYFVTQNSLDIPDQILGQLGNRIQHALRVYTAKDEKALKVAAKTFRTNKQLDVTKVIPNLAIGEALVSVLDLNGTPRIVQRTLIVPPRSKIGPIDADHKQTIIADSDLHIDQVEPETEVEYRPPSTPPYPTKQPLIVRLFGSNIGEWIINAIMRTTSHYLTK